MASATGLVLCAAQTMFAALECKELSEVCTKFKCESQLVELRRTVKTIKAVLLDVESKQQELTQEGRDWVESLKDAVYDVDDLLDEFRTVTQMRQQMKYAKLSKKVRRFFSRYNKFLVAFNTSKEIKKIRDKLDSISDQRKKFGFGEIYQPLKRKDETCSYVREESIIGRDEEKAIIVRMLLQDSKCPTTKQENVSFVTIVGIGGMGKTALAQLVYNDAKIKSAFELTFWVCVSEEFSIERILCKMLEKDGMPKEVLQREFRQKIEGKRYLLVLDDVWSEKREEWLTLQDFLVLGGKASRVLVTSRSIKVAKVIGNNEMYELRGLSEKNSWRLFQRMAFSEDNDQVDVELVEIGKEIVKKCVCIPLSIRVVGSLLYNEDKNKWISFLSLDLSKMGREEEGIMPILKFSYYHLTPPLKSCFSYCALFPKDYVMRKAILINLWLGHGCLDGIDDGRSLEDIGEDYFNILLQRCFIQDYGKNKYGEIHSCKMHDLIHDLAQEVAGQEVSSIERPLDSNIRHLLCYNDDVDISLSKMKKLRTFIAFDYCLYGFEELVDIIVANFRRLRVLSLKFYGESINNSLSNLIHLRYLDLTDNEELEVLPESITKLLNLQILELQGCRELKLLPHDLSKLVNLRHLNITNCSTLSHMPLGMGSLNHLHTLTMFVLDIGSSTNVQKGQVKDLKLLTNLRGELHIKLKSYNTCSETKMDEGGYLENLSQINSLIIEIKVLYDESFLESLNPPYNLRRLKITSKGFKSYDGIKLPPWATKMATSLPYLVHIKLYGFCKLQYLPSLSQLVHLKSLQLRQMDEVEFMEDDDGVVPLMIGSRTTKYPSFFRSLKQLELHEFLKLKRWWRDHKQCPLLDNKSQEVMTPQFPRLHTLKISRCPNLTSLPRCPHLKRVELHHFNETLRFYKRSKEAKLTNTTSPSHIFSSISSRPNTLLSTNFASSSIENQNSISGDELYILEELDVDNIDAMNSLFEESLRVTNLRIFNSMAESLSCVGFGGIENLRNLKTLKLIYCNNLVLGENEDANMLWSSLHNLTHLQLSYLPKVVSLPLGFQYLTALQSLQIDNCDNLEGLPDWINCLMSIESLFIRDCRKIKSLPEAIRRLPSLTRLEIRGCDDNLKARCQEPNGRDWSKIEHIPTRKMW